MGTYTNLAYEQLTLNSTFSDYIAHNNNIDEMTLKKRVRFYFKKSLKKLMKSDKNTSLREFMERRNKGKGSGKK